ncbi:MAG: alanine racemase, partial [Bacteroidales bacterium]|nr:alanine racemase [Bacteroidales bacterium]
LLEPSTKIMVMVKALSYGAGSYEIAEFLQHEKIDYLAVAFPDEGVRLRKAGVQLPVMVMNADLNDYRKLLEHQLEPEIYSREGLERFLKECRYMGLSEQSVHIKLDTGMHRLGFESEDVAWLCSQLTAREIRVKSLFTHLAGSDDASLDAFTKQQVEELAQMAGPIKAVAGSDVMLHALNSSGIERFPGLQLDMVRIGIGLYGQGSSEKLEPVSTFKTIISQIREVGPGETVGYGRSGVVHRESKIATIPVGYADGINRRLGNGNYAFFLNGRYAPTIGHVCMDMTMLDITDIDATVGDPVELFGKNCKVSAMADRLGTIVYEVLTSIPERVKRVYIRE